MDECVGASMGGWTETSVKKILYFGIKYFILQYCIYAVYTAYIGFAVKCLLPLLFPAI
jgi:hypothetical protein